MFLLLVIINKQLQLLNKNEYIDLSPSLKTKYSIESNCSDYSKHIIYSKHIFTYVQISELKQARQLATDITMSGAKLYELLAMEVDLRELRLAAVARPLEMSHIEQGMKNKVVTVEVIVVRYLGVMGIFRSLSPVLIDSIF